jgi:lipooligosaccharide transport system ATP-binding protein
MVEACLAVKDLKKAYRVKKTETLAVDGISFEVHPGECFGLLGPNGAGKSSTINCITGFYPPTSGQVLISGFNVYSDPKRARSLLGVCSQEDTLDTEFSVIDQLIRYAAFFRIPKDQSRERAKKLLARFNLTNESNSLVTALSGGMRRKLQVARALISSPKVLVLDEPSTGLDPDARRNLWDVLLEERGRGIGVLLSTHYMYEAERLCDRIAILHQGKILDVGSPEELVARHVGVTNIDETIRPGVVWNRPPNLEDVFLKLAGSRLEARVSA